MEQTIVSARTLKAKTYILLFLMMSLGSVGNTILDKGMKEPGTDRFLDPFRNLARDLPHLHERHDLAGHLLHVAFHGLPYAGALLGGLQFCDAIFGDHLRAWFRCLDTSGWESTCRSRADWVSS